MSDQSPAPSSAALHADLVAVVLDDAAPTPTLVALRDSTFPPSTPPEPVPAEATSSALRAVGAALAGVPVLLDRTGGGAAATAGLLSVLVGAGRSVAYLPGPELDDVRSTLGGLGLTGLLDDEPAPSDPGAPAAVDTSRLEELGDTLERHTRLLHGSPDADRPTLFTALAELLAQRAQHLHPPLIPAASGWDATHRSALTGLLSRPGATEPAPALDEAVQSALPDLRALPGAVGALDDLVQRLRADLSWRPPATLADVAAAVAVLDRVTSLQATYIPLALGTDLQQARAVLTQQPRSLLSAEERSRRREIKRLGTLRHDGTFGLADVDALQAVQDAWAPLAPGAPRPWTATAELAGRVEETRTLVARLAVSPGLPGVPARPEEVDLQALSRLSSAATELVDGATAAAAAPPVSLEGLEALTDAVPAGATADDVDRLVRGVWLRALAQDGIDGTATTAALVREFRELDGTRRASAVHRVRHGLATGSLPRVHVLTSPAARTTGVLVVDGSLPAAEVADLVRGAGQLVVLGTPAAAPGTLGQRVSTALTALTTGWPAAPEDASTDVVRDVVATALRSAGLTVTVGADVAGRPVDLLVSRSGADARLAVELDAVPHAALPSVQDREIARPAQLDAAGLGVHRVLTADWFREPRVQVQRVLEALTETTARRERADQERADREQADREQADREQADREQADRERSPATPAPVPEVAEPVTEAPVEEPATTPAPQPAPVVAPDQEPEPEPETPSVEVPRGLGRTADAESLLTEFRTAIGDSHPNIDQVKPTVVDAAVALAYGRLGLKAQDTAVLDVAMDLAGFRRRGVKVHRAFKESVQRSKKKMRGAGLKIS